ncbi:membrane protein insertion efficiency factor YidD [Duganella sp. PWIR1]|jgi:putative membrane protein insertion efficiency factor
MKTVLRFLLRFYQLAISPMMTPSCRFHPSCSNYALEALQVHGAAKGSLLAVKRVCRCHPWHPGGVDPVPPNSSTTACGCNHS